MLPERVDMALLIIPAEFVLEELERCGRAGIKAALIITSGFAEQRGDDGVEMQRRLREIAKRYDMLVCGPNTEGFANTAAALCATFSPTVDALKIPLIPASRSSGHVAVIGQSGGMGFAFFDRGRPKEIPFSYVITTGNEACWKPLTSSITCWMRAVPTCSCFFGEHQERRNIQTCGRQGSTSLQTDHRD